MESFRGEVAYLADTRMNITPTNDTSMGTVRYGCVNFRAKRPVRVEEYPWKVNLMNYRSCEGWVILEEGTQTQGNLGKVRKSQRFDAMVQEICDREGQLKKKTSRVGNEAPSVEE